MASFLHILSLTLFFTLLLSHTFSSHPPELAPSPSPLLSPQAISPSPTSPANPPDSLPPLSPTSPSLAFPPVDDDDEGYSSEQKKSPSPLPDVAADGDQRDESQTGAFESKDEDSGGMSGGQKAGIAIGVIAAGCFVALASLVYKRRQDNIRRAKYGFPERRSFL